MQKILRMLRWLLALATIAVIAALCWQAVDIYASGTAQRTDLFQPIYRWDDVAARLASLAPLLWGYAAFAAVALVLHTFARANQREPEARRSTPSHKHEAEPIRSEKPVRAIRIALYALAIIMVAWGVMNGGLRDVLVKAINICTECIGLG